MTIVPDARSICIIEDDELVRGHIAERLRDWGHTVFEAGSADDGVALIRKEKTDVAIVDILMPDRDGLEAIGQLRRTRPDLKIIAISGGGRVGADIYLRLAAQIGADTTLAKPVGDDDLRAALSDA